MSTNRQEDWALPAAAVGQRLLLTVSEAAQQLGIGRSLFYELLADGQVESIHVGRLRRIPADALTAYVDRQRGTTPNSHDRGARAASGTRCRAS